jgi:hypothetical protein
MNLGHIDTLIAFAAVMAGVSLIVTALTQAVSAVLGLRGLNLKWGLESLVRTFAPGLKAQAGRLAGDILLHPLMSASSFVGREKGFAWWRYATHIRKEELVKLLEQWANALALPQGNEAEQRARNDALDALKVPEELVRLGAAAQAKLDQLKRDLETWFDSSMDRASQRFAANMRIVTVAGAALVSLLFLFDSIELWRRLSSNPDLRARVVAGSDALLRKADEMAADSGSQPAGVYLHAAEQWLALHPNAVPKPVSTAGITNLASGLAWLGRALATNQVSDTNRFIEEYRALVPQAALRLAADNLTQVLDQQLAWGVFQSSYPASFGGWCDSVWAHRWGLLVSIVLLSLGAPFWFNLLRTMSNLRPLLANKATAEQQQKAKAQVNAG